MPRSAGEFDILQFLSEAGKLGFPFSNMAHNDLGVAEPRDFLATLQSLEKKGFVKFFGPRTLNDFAGLIEAKSASLVTLEQQKAAEYAGQTNHHILFSEENGFFETSIRPTLRGLMALAVYKASKNEKLASSVAIDDPHATPLDPKLALQQLVAKKEAERQAAEAARPAKAFEKVIYAFASGDDKDEKEWGYATEYWKKDEWAALAIHKRLVESNTVYRQAFEGFVEKQKKFRDLIEEKEDHITDGSLLSRMVENPFVRVALVSVFDAVTHPFSAVKLSHSYKTMSEIYEKERLSQPPAPSSPASIQPT